ncbi:MAG: hypothetical protein ACI9NY_000751 [Kiritimatiellia bacterium]|jgi:hypothetical protein
MHKISQCELITITVKSQLLEKISNDYSSCIKDEVCERNECHQMKFDCVAVELHKLMSSCTEVVQ